MAADPGSTDLVGRLKMLSPGRKKLMSKYFMLKDGESGSLVSEYFGVALAFVALGGMIRDVNLLKKTKQQENLMHGGGDGGGVEREPPKLHRMALEEMLKAAMERLRALAGRTQSLEEKVQERRNMEAGFQYERMELLKRAMAAEAVIGEKVDAEAAWRMEKAELEKRVAEADAQRGYFFNKMTEAEIRVTELNRLRGEDGKANAKLVAIYAGREQGWKAEKMKLRQEIEFLKERVAKLVLQSRTRAEAAAAAASSSLASTAEAQRTRILKKANKSSESEKMALGSKISISIKEDGSKAHQMVADNLLEDRGLERGLLRDAGDHQAGESMAHEALSQQQEMEAELAIILKRVGMLKKRGSGDNMLSEVHSAATASKSLVMVPVINVTEKDVVDKQGIQEQPEPCVNEQGIDEQFKPCSNEQGIGERPDSTSVRDVKVVADEFRKEIMHTLGTHVAAKTSQKDLHLVSTTCEPSSYGNPSPAKMITAEVPNTAADKVPSGESAAAAESQDFDSTGVYHQFGASGKCAAATESQDFDTMGVCHQFGASGEHAAATSQDFDTAGVYHQLGDAVGIQTSHTVESQKTAGEGDVSMQQEIGTSSVMVAHVRDRHAICKDVGVDNKFDGSSTLHMLPDNVATGVSLQPSADALSTLSLGQETVSDENLVEDDIAGAGGGIEMPVVEQSKEIIPGIDNVNNEASDTRDSSWGDGNHTAPENPKLYQSGDQEPVILPFTGIEDSSLEILENHEISQEPVTLPFIGIKDSSVKILENCEISQKPVILPFTGIGDSSLEILENRGISHNAAGSDQSLADSEIAWEGGMKESFAPSQEVLRSRKGLLSQTQLTMSGGIVQEVVEMQQHNFVDGELHLPFAETGDNRVLPKFNMKLDASDSRPQGSPQSFEVAELDQKEAITCVAPYNELPQQVVGREHVASLALVMDTTAGISWDGEVGRDAASTDQSLAENKEILEQQDVEDAEPLSDALLFFQG